MQLRTALINYAYFDFVYLYFKGASYIENNKTFSITKKIFIKILRNQGLKINDLLKLNPHEIYELADSLSDKNKL